MKIKYSWSLFFLSFLLLGCQQKIAYLTPQFEGQVIDRKTDQPISDVKVFLTSRNFTNTDTFGNFLIPPVEYKYWLIGPSHDSIRNYYGVSLIFDHKSYVSKLYTIGDIPSTTKTQGNQDYLQNKKFIDMGKVYLTPADPSILEMQEEIISDTLDYCQPNQSQKEVDCIPLPEGMTYKQISLNQPTQ
ncbi:hypothetical protein FW759_07150 [Psychrobacter sp. 1176_08]|uniref:hypothetical protein n=1 Tax=Psychrobacter sp. 1176_08 TaxID=2604452 RepID=UPI004064878A